MAMIRCVDADKPLVDLLGQALEREGFVVLAAHNGWDALRLAWEERPDVVVLDAKLPRMNGFDVLSMLRSFSRVPVIMLTEGADKENRRADFMRRARFVRGARDVRDLVVPLRPCTQRGAGPVRACPPPVRPLSGA